MLKKSVLFLCTGNSCRSQMAEAIVNDRLGRSWYARSAGTHPAVAVHPLALQVLSEIGIQHHGHPKSVDGLQGEFFILVITLCDSAARDCPIWFGMGRRLHHGFPDPALTGDIRDFRMVRDAILAELIPLLESFKPDGY